MHFRTVNDLFGCVRRNSDKLPRDVDLVVGVPRSGIQAACAISLSIHKPFVDLNSFLQGSGAARFSRRKGLGSDQVTSGRQSILVVDDSIFHGDSMREVRQAIDASGVACQTT